MNKWTRADILTVIALAVVFIVGKWAHNEYVEWKLFIQQKAGVIDAVGDSAKLTSDKVIEFADNVLSVFKRDVDAKVREVEARQKRNDALIEKMVTEFHASHKTKLENEGE